MDEAIGCTKRSRRFRMESRFLIGPDNPAGLVVRPHFLPWIRSLACRQLETRYQKKAFSVSVIEVNKELSLAVGGVTISVLPRLWETYINRYFETGGATDLASYRECGPLSSYLVRLADLFMDHLMDGRCECLGINSGFANDMDFQISPSLSRSN